MEEKCRSCLRPGRRLVQIHSERSWTFGCKPAIATVREMLVSCTQILVEKDDGLPQTLCLSCTNKVTKAYSFRDQTRRSDLTLRDSLRLRSEEDLAPEEKSHPKILNEEPRVIVRVEPNCDDLDVDKHSNELDSKIKITKKKVKIKVNNIRQTRLKKGKSEIKAVNLSRNLRSSRVNQKANNIETELSCFNKKDAFSILHNEVLETADPDDKKDISTSIEPEIKNMSPKADIKENYFENDIIESIATLNDAESTSFINKYAQDIEEAYFSNNIPNVKYEEDLLKPDSQSDHQEIWLEEENSNENNVENESETQNIKKNMKKEKESLTSLYDTPNKPQVCSVCNHKCANVNLLIKHRNKHHAPKKFQCLICGNGLTTTRGLRFHMRLHTGEKPEVCSICGKAFSDPRTLKNHERIHTGQQPYPCPMCDKRFPARLSLSLHLRSHTGERPYQCPQCDKSYVQANSLQIHMRTHTGIRPYSCKICNKAFTNNSSLSVHMITHSGVKNFQCTICGKRMARSGELTIHLRTHSGERPFICAVCHKSFTNSSALRAHTPTHTGVKNFVCTVCGKRVARAVELRVHMRTHTGERRYRCPHCDQSFSTNSNMRLHQRKHTGEKPFACEFCNRRFADSHVLRNHVRTHTGEKPFTCETCGHAFAQHASLRTHLNTHHKASKSETASETKKSWNPSKESQTYSQLPPISTKPPEFINNLDDTSLSKILSSAVDRNGGLNLRECLPIEMADGIVNSTVSLVNNFNNSLVNAMPIMGIIPRDADNYMSTCSSTSIS